MRDSVLARSYSLTSVEVRDAHTGTAKTQRLLICYKSEKSLRIVV